MNVATRRQFLRRLGLSSAALPFLPTLHSLGQTPAKKPAQRIVFMFSPNGTIPTRILAGCHGRRVRPQAYWRCS